MVAGKCFTNLDNYVHEDWPDKFVAVPQPGEMVEAKSGRILKVVRVTHKICDGIPYLRIELNK